MRSDEAGLPDELHTAIDEHTGPISAVVPAPVGNHADIASALETRQGRVFLKAARKLEDGDGPEVLSLRAEAAVNEHVTEFAPRLLWTAETDEWLALGFEYVQGRPADYTPGSQDLELLTDLIHTLQSTPCPDAVQRQIGRRWQQQTDISPFLGNTLLHADLNSGNLIVTSSRVYLVDWAFVSRGAPWLEPGLLAPWLILAGHTPHEIDAWFQRFPSWAQADADEIDLFSKVFAAAWQARTTTAEWAAGHAARAQRWADYRLGRRSLTNDRLPRTRRSSPPGIGRAFRVPGQARMAKVSPSIREHLSRTYVASPDAFPPAGDHVVALGHPDGH